MTCCLFKKNYLPIILGCEFTMVNIIDRLTKIRTVDFEEEESQGTIMFNIKKKVICLIFEQIIYSGLLLVILSLF